MQRLKSIGIAVAMLCLLCLIVGVNSSDADIEIVELRSYNDTTVEYDYGSTYFTFYVRTNEPYGGLLWYVDGDWEWGTLGDRSSQDHYFGLNLPGSIKGNTYEIEVFAVGIAPNGHLVLPTDDTDTATYDFTVLKPIVISGFQTPSWEKPRVTGVFGYNELTRHYFDGTNIIMEGWVYAYNQTGEDCSATAWFRHTGPNGFQEEHPAPRGLFGPNQPSRSYGPYRAKPMRLNYFVGGPIGENRPHTLNAHIHLQVTGNGAVDVWHGINGFDTTFTSADNPSP
jgi:hypothetical protein